MYFSKQAGSFSGVPQSTVQLWTEKGLVDSTETTGTGVRRQYSELNCIQIGIVKALRDKGVSLRSIESVMKNLIPKKNLELHLKEKNTFLILRLDTDRVINAPQKSVFSFPDTELENDDFKGKWVYLTIPLDSEEVRIMNLSRIAKKVLEKME